MNFEAFNQVKEEDIEEIVAASEDPEETLKQLTEQLQNHISHLEEQYWDRARFCSCGAESVTQCECDKEKRKGYMKRTSRKINDELGETAITIQLLKTEYEISSK